MTTRAQIGVMGNKAHIEGGIHFHGDRIYQFSSPAFVDIETLCQAKARLAEMPLDNVPEPATIPPVSRLTFAYNPLFVGRKKDLKTLASLLNGGQKAAIGKVVAATGMGGIGKTQLASEFTHRYGQYFAGGVYWLNFADATAVPTEVASCSGYQEGHFDFETRILSVLSAWQSEIPRLLIFDNCEDEALFDQWRPKTGASRVLITSRRPDWNVTLGITTVAIGGLEREESIELLCTLYGQLNKVQASAIARELGDLPLALHLAGTFLSRYANEVSPDEYLTQLQDKYLLEHPSLQGRGGQLSPTGHELHVARTFALSYDRLDPKDNIDQIGIDLLFRAACFAPGVPIPIALLLRTLKQDNNATERLDWADGLDRILKLGLIATENEGFLNLHRLLAEFVNKICSEKEDKHLTAIECVVEGLFDEFPGVDFEDWSACESLLPHIKRCANLVEIHGLKCINAGRLFGFTGKYLYESGQLDEAAYLWKLSLNIYEKTLGYDCPIIAPILCNLGQYYCAMAQFTEAESLFFKGLELLQRPLKNISCNEDDEIGAKSVIYNNLGELYRAWGNYLRAEYYYNKAARILEDDPSVPGQLGLAVVWNNLSELYASMGKSEQSVRFCAKSLHIKELQHGPSHPDLIPSLINMANRLKEKDKFKESESFLNRAMNICEQTLGKMHPFYSTILNNLGSINRNIGEYAKCERFFRESLIIDQSIYGENHPSTAKSKSNLASVYHSDGKLDAAKSLLEDVAKLRETILGEKHPDTAVALRKLSDVLNDMGSIEPALLLCQRALKIEESIFGVDHIELVPSLKSLAGIHRKKGECRIALKLLQREKGILIRSSSKRHSVLALCLNDIGALLEDLGQNKRAASFYKQAIEIYERQLGKAHPDLVVPLLNYAGILSEKLNRKDKAAKFLARADRIKRQRGIHR